MYEYIRLNFSLRPSDPGARHPGGVLTGPIVYRAVKTGLARLFCAFGTTHCARADRAGERRTTPVERCRLAEVCPYGLIFADRGSKWRPPFAPFVIAESGRARVEITLYGSTWRLYPWIAMGVERACRVSGRGGLAGWEIESVSRIRADGDTQELCAGPLAAMRADLEPDFFRASMDPFRAPAPLVIRFESPTRFKKDGVLINTGRIDFRTLIAALLERLSDVYGDRSNEILRPDVREPLEAEAGRVPVLSSRTRWEDVPDRSGRQAQDLLIGGWLGEVVYGPDAMRFLPLLLAGETLHVGGKVAFGCGRITVAVLQQ